MVAGLCEEAWLAFLNRSHPILRKVLRAVLAGRDRIRWSWPAEGVARAAGRSLICFLSSLFLSLLSFFLSLFLKIKFPYLKNSYRKTEIFHLLAHSPDGHHGQSWAGPRPGARSSPGLPCGYRGLRLTTVHQPLACLLSSTTNRTNGKGTVASSELIHCVGA